MFLAAYAPPGAVLDARGPIFENDAFAALRRRHSDLLAALTGGRRQATTVLDGRAVSWTITIQADQPRRTIILAQDDGADDEDDAGMKMRPSKRSRTDSQGSFVPLLSPPSSSSSSCFNAPVQTPPSLQPSSLPLSSLFSSSTPTQAVPSPTAPAHSWIHDPRFRALATALGTAGELLRTHDWSATALGPVHTWSVELVTLFGTILHSQSGACLVWGPAHVLLYNSAYIALLGRDKHPAAFGARVRDVWAEVLPEVGPLIARTLAGEGFLLDDRQLLMARPVLGGGDVEEVHITFSCVPIYGAEGEVQGVYAPVVETSPKIRSERRMAALCRLATRLTTARTLADTLSGTCEVLSGLEEDFPYAAAYIVADGDGRSRSSATIALQDTVAIPFDTPPAPARLVINADGPPAPGAWPVALHNVVRDRQLAWSGAGVEAMLERAALPQRGSVPRRPLHAAALPVMEGGALVGVLVVYVGAGQPVDARLNDFLHLLGRQLSTSASMAASYAGELRKLEEMAALDRAKTSFFTNVSHELRTPLTLILGPVQELLRASPLSAHARAQLGIVARNGVRLLRLVNAIMDFATAEAGRLRAAFRPTALGPRTADLASAFRAAAALAGLEYTVDVARVPPDVGVWVDRDKYEQVLCNLLSNALKYTRAGGVGVTAYVEHAAGRFVLEVRDTGVGVPPTELPRIFDKFYRVQSAAGAGVEGTGIGLSYTRELVRLHRGEISVESEVGVGSVFRVFLPLGREHLPQGGVVDDEPEEVGVDGWAPADSVRQCEALDGALEDGNKEADLVSEDATGGAADVDLHDIIWRPLTFDGRSRARILVVDDNADMRQYITGLLAKYCDVVACADGAEALAALQARQTDYDLVLSDDMMPRMTGPELLAAVRADAALCAMPFIVLSARAGDDARVDGLARGADDYLAKPFRARELVLRAHAQLQAASTRRRLEARAAAQTRDLAESRGSFGRLCERLHVGVHRSDPTGAVCWANRKWMATFGDAEDGRWNNWMDAVHPDDRVVSTDAYSAAIEARKGFSAPIEVRIRDGDATTEDAWLDVIYELQPEFAPDAPGELLGWIGVWSDVSNLRRLQRQATEVERAHTAAAERSRELQEQFIDITCHELRNPLNAIYNSAVMVGESLARIDARLTAMRGAEGGAQSPEFEQLHAEIQEDIDGANTIVLCARHQKRITDDVLNMSKLSAGLITLVFGDFTPCYEVKNTVRMFRDDVAARGVQLLYEQDPSIDALGVDFVRGDSGRFVQVIVNLISNAIKFTENVPRRVVRVRIGATLVQEDNMGVDGDAWPEMDQEELLPMCDPCMPRSRPARLRLYVAVADSGVGMNLEDQTRLFQRFAQANPRTYGEFGGSGLGLYVSRMLVELHGGKIHMQSTKGVGTIVRFFLTVDRSTVVPTPPSTPVETSSELIFPVLQVPDDRRLRVLVVEDNQINQQILVKLLKSLQCDTHTCKDGQECVDLIESLVKGGTARESGFDLILMDLEMPILDGLGATRKIRQLEADGVLAHRVPIVAVSGNARSEWTQRARSAGMDAFVRKPYSKAELAELLQRWRSASAPTSAEVPVV